MAKATIGGETILGSPVQWTLRSGVRPAEAEFQVSPEAADSLTKDGLSPVELKIDSPGADGITIKHLFVLQQRPASTPHTRMVLVVDRRWFWDRKHVDHTFNARRTTGYKRVKAGFKRPEIDPVDAKIRYGPWSLPPGATEPWSAEKALKEVWETIKESEEEGGGSAPSLVIESEVSKLGSGTLPLEDVTLFDNGQVAMKRLLDFIPGAEITVDADGTVRVYSVATGEEKNILGKMEPEQAGGGHAMPISNARIRPSEVRIFFAPEVELRFDFQEADGGTAEPKGGISRDTYLENVLPIPDYDLSVNATKQAQGTWITIGEALAAWSKDSKIKITVETLRYAMAPGMDIWTGIKLAGLSDSKADWASRIAALQTHYRRTYRINQQVVRAVRSIRAYRTATVNPQTGSRAPATAYQNWAVVPTQRFLSVQLSASDSYAFAQNVNGYPDDDVLDGKPAAPIEVRVIDSDQGIIGLNFKADPFRVHEQFLPSHIDRIPTGKIKGGLIAWNSIEAGEDPPALSASHKVSIVLTVVPASPNSKSRLYQMTRTPSDLKGLLPGALSAGLGDARGPPMDVFVGPGWEVARIAWSEKDGTAIKRAFDFMPTPKGKTKLGVSELPESLIVNLAAQKGIGNAGASMDAIANALAAAVYAGHADRMEGSRTTPVTHAARIAGFIESVVHRVLPSGEASSTVSVMRQKSPVDLMSFMPASTRAIVLRLATSGKAIN